MSYVSPEPNSGCWLWMGGLTRGYGMAYLNGKKIKAHRAVWQMHRGPIPAGMTLDHLCRVTSCVNPNHLEPVTANENLMRGFGWGAVNRRKTACIRGHEFSGRNLHVDANGKRKCRACHRVCALRAYYRRREAKTA